MQSAACFLFWRVFCTLHIISLWVSCACLSARSLLDYKRFRAIADKVGAFLWCDMAHFSGFVAAGIFESPFDYCEVVTTTTHKTLR